MLYAGGRRYQASRGLAGDQVQVPDLQRTTPMTIEILYLTAQIHRWLNERVARYLAAEAAKLSH
jgi:hypothetical protein